MTTTFARIQPRRKTAADWTATNEILLAGERGYETDTHREKVGDGTTPWTSLPYQAPDATSLAATYEALKALPTAATSNGTLALNSVNKVDATTGSLTMTLPTSARGSILVKKTDTTAHTVAVTGNIDGGTSTVSLAWYQESVLFESDGTTWTSTGGHKRKTDLDLSYGQEVNPKAFPYYAKFDGTTDDTVAVQAAITAAAAANGVVRLPAGTTVISSLSCSNVAVIGAGRATVVRVPDGAASAPVFTLGAGGSVKSLQVLGGSNATTSSSNPSIPSAIKITGTFTTVSDIDFTAVNGWCVESDNTVSVAGLTITKVRGFYNRGGIHIKSYSSTGYIAQAIISNINLQICQGADVLFFEDANDIQVNGINACFDGSVAGIYGIHVKGSSSSMFFQNVDVGVFPNNPGISPVVFIESDGAGHAPANIQFTGGILQSGRNGARIDDGTNITFRGIQFSRNASHAVYIPSTTAKYIVIDDCHFVVNGAVAARLITDAVTTNGSAVITSATAAFTQTDVGMLITGPGLSSAAYILSVQSATQVTLTANATATASGVSMTVNPSAEIFSNTTNSVEVSRNRFETPYGTAASQVAYVLRCASPFNATVVRDNILLGGHPTANLYLGVAPKFIQDNVGYNPLGWQTVAVPATTGSAGGTAVPRVLYVTANASGACTCTITGGSNGSATQNIVIPAGQCVPIYQYPGANVQFTYTNAPTMVVFAM